MLPEPAKLSLLQARANLGRLGLRARRGLGQNFLVDPLALAKIVSTANISANDIIVEIGAGLGSLTVELARRAHNVLAIEVDPKLCDFLSQSLSLYPNVCLVRGDILELDLVALLSDFGEGTEIQSGTTKGSKLPYKVIANIPYYITAPILRRFLDSPWPPQLMVLTVQKEVARRITAGPGDLSLLGVSVQFFGKPLIVGYVPKQSFYPQPRVDSAIVSIEVYSPEDRRSAMPAASEFFLAVRAGFSQPRKYLKNSLAHGLSIPVETATLLLLAAGIDPQRRPQSLALEEWGLLALFCAKPRDTDNQLAEHYHEPQDLSGLREA